MVEKIEEASPVPTEDTVKFLDYRNSTGIFTVFASDGVTILWQGHRKDFARLLRQRLTY